MFEAYNVIGKQEHLTKVISYYPLTFLVTTRTIE
ncbi:hypothetical protein Lser_V15G19252 [Lactuca serriola]